MRFFATGALCAAALLAAPLAASEPPKEDKQDTPTKVEAEKDKKICRYVGDTGSRSKKRLCLTAEEWVRYNRGE